jgi:hypothetical protein
VNILAFCTLLHFTISANKIASSRRIEGTFFAKISRWEFSYDLPLKVPFLPLLSGVEKVCNEDLILWNFS